VANRIQGILHRKRWNAKDLGRNAKDLCKRAVLSEGQFQWPVRRRTVQAKRGRADGRKSVGRCGGAISRRMQKKCTQAS
jgi:hypothetical protein